MEERSPSFQHNSRECAGVGEGQVHMMELDEDTLVELLNPLERSARQLSDSSGLSISNADSACKSLRKWVRDHYPVEVEFARRKRATRKCCDGCGAALEKGRMELRVDYRNQDGYHLVLCGDCMQTTAVIRTLEWLRSRG
jgi:hypothetical protein